MARPPAIRIEELATLPEHLSSPPVFSGARVTRSLVLCVCFVDRRVASSSIRIAGGRAMV
jgi:hypothetical protein